jgi:hypothetical protein
MTETPTLTLDAEVLSVADYRSLREGKSVAPIVLEETPAADAAAKPTTETADESGSLETNLEETPAKKSGNLDKRFAELTGEIKTLKTQLAAAKPAAVQTEAAVKPAVVVPPVLPPDPNDLEPNADRFTDYVEWQKAWNRWDRRQDTRAAVAAAEVTKRTDEAQAKGRVWGDSVKAAITEHADFEAVALNKDLEISRVMGDAIRDSGVGTSILYRLGQAPEEAARISKLSPLAQVRELGKIEAAIEAESEAAGAAEETEPLPKKIIVSKAPTPHKPVSGATAATPSKNLETMSQSEYRAYRESGKIR